MTETQMTDHTQTHTLCDNQPGVACWHVKENPAANVVQPSDSTAVVVAAGSSEEEEVESAAAGEVVVEVTDEDGSVKASADSSLGLGVVFALAGVAVALLLLRRFVLKD
jgi:hypothetical protein